MARAALGDLDRAIDEMNASARIHPIDPSRWYRLACLHARKVSRDPEDAEGDGKKAVEHLMVAVRAGFEGWAAIERSADLASIRGRADYRAWIASVRDGASGRGGAGAPP
jgi:hypothetical protein